MIERSLLQTFPKRFSFIYDIEKHGEVLSSNKFYAGFRGTQQVNPDAIRSALKNKYAKKFRILLTECKAIWLDEFSLVVYYNTLHDCDNIQLMSKICVDTMKKVYIKNDGFNIYKSFHVIKDKSLPKGTIEFNFVGK